MSSIDTTEKLLDGLFRAASRRSFLRRGALTALSAPAVVGGLGACVARAEDAAQATTTAGAADAHAAHDSAAAGLTSRAEEMDRKHEAGIRAFPAKTEGKGGVLLQPRLEGRVKVYDLEASEIQWEVEPGRRVKALAYNAMVPGPEIRVREGDRVRINLANRLNESTSIHFHGLETPNDQDGVPFITQPPIRPGETYTYEFTVPNAGSHMYHSHHNAGYQVPAGLLGAFIVEPRDASKEPRVDLDYVMILNDGYHGYTINGKGFPATEPLTCKVGEKVRIRFMNEGVMIHPMHLHGMHFTVISKDGWPQPMPWKCDTLNIAPGERYDVIVNADNPGVWAFHCHVLTHAESPHGMFGMVTVLHVRS